MNTETILISAISGVAASLFSPPAPELALGAAAGFERLDHVEGEVVAVIGAALAHGRRPI